MMVQAQGRAGHTVVAAPGVRIEEIRATIFNLRLVAPYRWAAGSYHGRTNVVVEVRTADGLVGLGEASNWRHAALIEGEIAPRLLGANATDLRSCWTLAIPPVAALANVEGAELIRAFGAVEMALWDLRAKLHEVPLYQLLGGAARSRIPFTEYFAARERVDSYGGEGSPAEIAEYCERAVQEWGSPFFEGKVGWEDLDTDLKLVKAVRDAIGPTRPLKLDANGGWTLGTAQAALQQMAGLGISNVEDPTMSFEDMATLRRWSSIPFSTHNPDIRAAVRLGVPDTFVLNATSLGGIERTLRFVATCEAFNRGFSFYSCDSGIGTAAYLHMAASQPYLSAPSQSLLRWYANDVVAGGPFCPSEGHIAVPEGPGLGVDIDRDALQAAHGDFCKHGDVEQAGPDVETGRYSQLPLY